MNSFVLKICTCFASRENFRQSRIDRSIPEEQIALAFDQKLQDFLEQKFAIISQ